MQANTRPFRWNRIILVIAGAVMLSFSALLALGLALGRVVPEADLMAFMYDNDLENNWDIFVMDMRVGIGQPIVASTAQDRYPEWSPDGQQLIYHANPDAFDPTTMTNPFDLFITDETGADPQVLYISAQPGNQDYNEAMAAWSPDGTRIAFHYGSEYGGASSNYRIIISDPTGQMFYKPLEMPDDAGMIYATWSPDGTRIAYVLSRSAAATTQQTNPNAPSQPYTPPQDELYVLEVGTEIGGWAGEPELLLTTNERLMFPAWSPTSEQIVYVTTNRASGAIQGEALWVMDANGGNGREVVPAQPNVQNTTPDWLPDGSAIIFASMRDNFDFDIYQVNPDGSGLRRLTHMPGNEMAPDWRPR